MLGALYLVQDAVPHMPRGSRIINIGSVISKLGVNVMSTYGASKAALDSFTFSWAEEVRIVLVRSFVEGIPNRSSVWKI